MIKGAKSSASRAARPSRFSVPISLSACVVHRLPSCTVFLRPKEKGIKNTLTPPPPRPAPSSPPGHTWGDRRRPLQVVGRRREATHLCVEANPSNAWSPLCRRSRRSEGGGGVWPRLEGCRLTPPCVCGGAARADREQAGVCLWKLKRRLREASAAEGLSCARDKARRSLTVPLAATHKSGLRGRLCRGPWPRPRPQRPSLGGCGAPRRPRSAPEE